MLSNNVLRTTVLTLSLGTMVSASACVPHEAEIEKMAFNRLRQELDADGAWDYAYLKRACDILEEQPGLLSTYIHKDYVEYQKGTLIARFRYRLCSPLWYEVEGVPALTDDEMVYDLHFYLIRVMRKFACIKREILEEEGGFEIHAI